jgi:hypothetical protein
MRSGVVIIVDVIWQDAAQLIFTDDDQMIETFSANRAYYAFGVWILEGRSSPIELEALPVPFDDGLRFDNDQDLPPILPELREAPRRIDPADAVRAGEISG